MAYEVHDMMNAGTVFTGVCVGRTISVFAGVCVRRTISQVSNTAYYCKPTSLFLIIMSQRRGSEATEAVFCL